MLEDLAAMLGGTRLGNAAKSINAMTWDDIGIAKKVVSTSWNTIFYGDEEREEEIIKRIDQLKAQKETVRSEYDKTLLEDRAAGLACAVAKIVVGGATDLEIIELYHRYEDALNSCKAAIKEGIVPGGGVSLIKAAKFYDTKDLSLGEKILKDALNRPMCQILENIGLPESEIKSIIKIIGNDRKNLFTYDARNKKKVDALKVGIVDPVLVVKTALKNAVSIATLLSTAGGGVIFDRKDK